MDGVAAFDGGLGFFELKVVDLPFCSWLVPSSVTVSVSAVSLPRVPVVLRCVRACVRACVYEREKALFIRCFGFVLFCFVVCFVVVVVVLLLLCVCLFLRAFCNLIGTVN